MTWWRHRVKSEAIPAFGYTTAGRTFGRLANGSAAQHGRGSGHKPLAQCGGEGLWTRPRDATVAAEVGPLGTNVAHSNKRGAEKQANRRRSVESGGVRKTLC